MNKEKQTTIFIDTEDMEERYAKGLYVDYLKEENQQLKDRINKAIEYIESGIYYPDDEDDLMFEKIFSLTDDKLEKLLEMLKGE